MSCNLIIVKLVSSIIFVLKPISLLLYVKWRFPYIDISLKGNNKLEQKWNGLSQHIAYFLHSNTDVAVLTLFGNLKLVAVYSIYYMIASQIQSLTTSFTTGMESLFGDMLAKQEYKLLHKTFGYYETIISIIAVFLYSATFSLIIPFVKIYTNNVNDNNYLVPSFSILLLLACLVFCLRTPYHSIIIAAGHFKETKMAAYGEALINITLSILFVYHFGLIGVAVGTLVATLYRFIYYVIYLSKNIFNRPIVLWVKRCIINIFIFTISSFSAYHLTSIFQISSIFEWIYTALIVTLNCFIITILFNMAFYYKDVLTVLKRKV